MGKSTRHVYGLMLTTNTALTWQLLVPTLLRTKSQGSLFRSGSNLTIPAYTTYTSGAFRCNAMKETNFKLGVSGAIRVPVDGQNQGLCSFYVCTPVTRRFNTKQDQRF